MAHISKNGLHRQKSQNPENPEKMFALRGGKTFFRAFINSELGLPEVAPCMA